MLIDAGTTESGEKVASYIAGLGYSRIDYVIATHPHEDHIGGMARVLRSFDIGEIWMPRSTSNTTTFEGLLDVIAEKSIPVHAAEEGEDHLLRRKLFGDDSLAIRDVVFRPQRLVGHSRT